MTRQSREMLEFEMLEFRGLKFRQPKDAFGVEVLHNGKWYGIEALYLRDITKDYANVPDIGLWIDRSYHGSARFEEASNDKTE